MKKLLFGLILTFLFSAGIQAQSIDVWIVRHAEKDKSNPQEKNPDLSDEGKIRAKDLVEYLKKVKFDGVFSTPYKRTHQTVDSLAKINNLVVKDYNPTDSKKLVDEIKKDFLGKKVMIVGHSNTVLELIEAFGGKRPKPELTDDDYDYIFHLIVRKDKASVKMSEYGKPHHL